MGRRRQLRSGLPSGRPAPCTTVIIVSVNPHHHPCTTSVAPLPSFHVHARKMLPAVHSPCQPAGAACARAPASTAALPSPPCPPNCTALASSGAYFTEGGRRVNGQNWPAGRYSDESGASGENRNWGQAFCMCGSVRGSGGSGERETAGRSVVGTFLWVEFAWGVGWVSKVGRPRARLAAQHRRALQRGRRRRLATRAARLASGRLVHADGAAEDQRDGDEEEQQHGAQRQRVLRLEQRRLLGGGLRAVGRTGVGAVGGAALWAGCRLLGPVEWQLQVMLALHTHNPTAPQSPAPGRRRD